MIANESQMNSTNNLDSHSVNSGAPVPAARRNLPGNGNDINGNGSTTSLSQHTGDSNNIVRFGDMQPDSDEGSGISDGEDDFYHNSSMNGNIYPDLSAHMQPTNSFPQSQNSFKTPDYPLGLPNDQASVTASTTAASTTGNLGKLSHINHANKKSNNSNSTLDSFENVSALTGIGSHANLNKKISENSVGQSSSVDSASLPGNHHGSYNQMQKNQYLSKPLSQGTQPSAPLESIMTPARKSVTNTNSNFNQKDFECQSLNSVKISNHSNPSPIRSQNNSLTSISKSNISYNGTTYNNHSLENLDMQIDHIHIKNTEEIKQMQKRHQILTCILKDEEHYNTVLSEYLTKLKSVGDSLKTGKPYMNHNDFDHLNYNLNEIHQESNKFKLALSTFLENFKPEAEVYQIFKDLRNKVYLYNEYADKIKNANAVADKLENLLEKSKNPKRSFTTKTENMSTACEFLLRTGGNSQKLFGF